MSALHRWAPHLVLAAVIGGLLASVAGDAPVWAAPLTGFAALLVAALRLRPRAAIAATLALMCAGAWVWGTWRVHATAPARLELPLSIDTTGIVDDTPRRTGSGGWRAVVRVDSGPATGARILATAFGQVPDIGDRIAVRGRLRSPARPGDAGWWRRYLLRRGISARIGLGAQATLLGRRGGAMGLRDTAARGIARRINDRVPGDAGVLVQGVVLGGSDGLDASTRDEVRDSGLSHLVAVSGQNVAIIVVTSALLLRTLGVARTPVLVATSLAVFGYCALCESGPSVWRACVSAQVALAAHSLSRSRDRWYVVLAALAVLLAYRPRDVGDPGLQLSFAAVVGILALTAPLARGLAGWIPERIGQLIAVSLAASLATAPVMVWNFNAVSIVGVVANVVAVPLASVILMLGLAGAVTAPFLGPPAALALWAAGWCAAVVLDVAAIGAAVPGASLDVPGWAAPLAGIPAVAVWGAGRRAPTWHGRVAR
ncbi:MAG: ComEC/Rec2 family competence protein [Thermoleophilia bacterium]